MANKTPFTEEQARKCPIHGAILEQCKLEMDQHNYCNKEHALMASGFASVGSAINWNYIRKFLEEDRGDTLLAVSEAFFEGELIRLPGNKRRTRVLYSPKKHPEKCLAVGYGKTCKGFASMEIGEGRLAVKALEIKEAIANGVKDAHVALATSVVESVLIPNDTKKQIVHME